MTIDIAILEKAFDQAVKEYDITTPSGLTAKRFAIWCARHIIAMEKQGYSERNSFLLRFTETDERLYCIAENLAKNVKKIKAIPHSNPTNRYYYRIQQVGVYPETNRFAIDADELLKNIVDYCPHWEPDNKTKVSRCLDEVVQILKEASSC